MALIVLEKNKEDRLILGVLLFLAIVKLSIHFYSNGLYGFHRDELLHAAVGEHLAWGFMEFPPLIGVFAKIQRFLFGNEVMAIRVFPALIGAAMVVITGWMAKEMGGKLIAVLIAACSVLFSLAYFRNHTLFQPVAFDQLFWLLGYWMLIKYLKSNNGKYLLYLGIVAGLGLMTKYTMLFWGVGITVGLIFHEKGSAFKNVNIWIAGLIAFLIFLPNIIWQASYNFPVLAHFTGLYEVQLDDYSRIDFLVEQVLAMNPFNAPIWILGVGCVLFNKSYVRYRPLAIAFLVSGLALLLAKGKSYYFFAAYPAAFAAGALVIEQLIKKKWIIAIWLVVALVICAERLPFMLPILPIESFVSYADLEINKEGRVSGLTSDYADMFGWEEQVALVDSIYQSLSPDEKKHTIIWAENYGEAGAVKIIGDNYNLPDPVCKHGSFWLWGAGENDGEIAISLGNEEGAVSYFYEEYQLIKMIKHPYAIDEEHNIPLYLCRKPKVKFQDYWPKFESRIFE